MSVCVNQLPHKTFRTVLKCSISEDLWWDVTQDWYTHRLQRHIQELLIQNLFGKRDKVFNLCKTIEEEVHLEAEWIEWWNNTCSEISVRIKTWQRLYLLVKWWHVKKQPRHF